MLSLILIAGTSIVTTSTPAAQEAKQSVLLSKNGEFIANHYPPQALAAGEQGKVSFQLVVEPDGSLGTCTVTASSGFKSLDNETCELILRHARMQPVRNSEGRAVRAVQNGFINWKHPRPDGKPLAVRTASAGQLPDKIICRKSAATGSLVKRTKQCMASREWSETQRIQRDRAYEIIGKGHYDGAVCVLPSGLPC
jgi:TonB family protein